MLVPSRVGVAWRTALFVLTALAIAPSLAIGGAAASIGAPIVIAAPVELHAGPDEEPADARSRSGREISFAERVRAEEALERVAYAHRIGETRPFEEAVPSGVVEEKVRAALERSSALETDWAVRITEGMLQDEIERMKKDTRMPGRLNELFEALGGDEALARECLARPALAERLLREAGASTAPLPGGSGSVSMSSRPALLCPDARRNHTAVWTGNVMIVWGGLAGLTYLNTGGRYDPVTDTWTPTSTQNAPGARHQHTAVWTGEEMIVWGGYRFDGVEHYLGDGGRYDPVTDTWSPLPSDGAPPGRTRHTAVWTGSEMIVWGGARVDLTSTTYYGSGGRYDPVSDSWSPTSVVDAPSARGGHTAVWTGSEMIVWGGFLGTLLRSTGGRYDPAADHWTPTSTEGAPQGRRDHRAVWTGEKMIVWGGYRKDVEDRFLASGGTYDPGADEWSATSTAGAPAGRVDHTAVWTGTEMIVWGGRSVRVSDLQSTYYDTGGRYDPEEDSWTATTREGAPSPRSHHSAVETGSSMLVWGGFGSFSGLESALRDGAGYDDDPGGWTAIDPSCPLPACSDQDDDGYSACLSSCDGAGSLCGDCDDAQDEVSPLALETTAAGGCADGIDNDCDGSADGADPGCALPACPDADGDGYAVCSAGCDPGNAPCGDCNDGGESVNPAAQEGSVAAGTCSDAVDNDCDGGADRLDPGCFGPLAPAAGTTIGPRDPIPVFQWNADGAPLTRVVFSDQPSLMGIIYRPTPSFGASEMWTPTEAQWIAMLKKLASRGQASVYWGIEVKDGRAITRSGALALAVRPAATPVVGSPSDGSELARAGPLPTFRWTGAGTPRRVVLEFAKTASFAIGLKAYVLNPPTVTEWTPTASKWKAITAVAGRDVGGLWWRVTSVDAIGRATHSEPTFLGID